MQEDHLPHSTSKTWCHASKKWSKWIKKAHLQYGDWGNSHRFGTWWMCLAILKKKKSGIQHSTSWVELIQLHSIWCGFEGAELFFQETCSVSKQLAHWTTQMHYTLGSVISIIIMAHQAFLFFMRMSTICGLSYSRGDVMGNKFLFHNTS